MMARTRKTSHFLTLHQNQISGSPPLQNLLQPGPKLALKDQKSTIKISQIARMTILHPFKGRSIYSLRRGFSKFRDNALFEEKRRLRRKLLDENQTLEDFLGGKHKEKTAEDQTTNPNEPHSDVQTLLQDLTGVVDRARSDPNSNPIHTEDILENPYTTPRILCLVFLCISTGFSIYYVSRQPEGFFQAGVERWKGRLGIGEAGERKRAQKAKEAEKKDFNQVMAEDLKRYAEIAKREKDQAKAAQHGLVKEEKQNLEVVKTQEEKKRSEGSP